MTQGMTNWKSRQLDLQKTLAELDLPPVDHHIALTQLMAHLKAERQSFPAQAHGREKAAGEAALVQMSLMVARAINALRKEHPEVMKEAKPPPPPALQSPPQVKAAAPAPAAKPPPPAEPARPQGPSLFSRATSWLSRSIPAAAEKIRGTISENLPSPKTVTTLTARFAGAAALSVGLAATFRADTSHEGQQAVITPVPARVMAKAAPLPPAPKLVAAAPVPAVRETAEPSAKSATQSRRAYRMDDLFHQEDALEEALDKLEQMPVDEAFGKAVLVESGDRQHDAGGRVVTSHKGATGAAQVLPSTAKIIAIGCTGKPLDQDRFRNDKSYNKSLGRCYYSDQAARYNDSPVLAALAYNMGYGNLDKHIARVGDPTKGEIGMVDFIKKIRITETRHYVLHMLGKAGFIEVPKGRGGRRQAQPEEPARSVPERHIPEAPRLEAPRLVPAFDEARLERPLPVLHSHDIQAQPISVNSEPHDESPKLPATVIPLPEVNAASPTLP